MRGWMKQIMVWLVAAACGFAAALVICRWSGNAFGLFMWPVIAAGAGFVVAGVGFFTTEGKSEILYGICAAACLFCKKKEKVCQEKILDTFFLLCYSITVAMSERCRIRRDCGISDGRED